jgi:hypothetical protein
MLAVTIETAGTPINLGLGRVSVTLDEERAWGYVSLHHPAFTKLTPGHRHQAPACFTGSSEKTTPSDGSAPSPPSIPTPRTACQQQIFPRSSTP